MAAAPPPERRHYEDTEVVTPCPDGVERYFRFQGTVNVEWDQMPRPPTPGKGWTVQPHTCPSCRATHEEGREPIEEHIEAEETQTGCHGYCGFHPSVARLLRRKRTEQHTPEWYQYRKMMLTASNLAPIVGAKGAFSSKRQLFHRKTGDWDANTPFTDSPAMAWGRKYEDEAGRVFEQVTGIPLYKHDIGLLEHPDYEWVGASPDFVGMYDPVLVETKVPYSRTITHECPDKYWTQIQMQLAVCDLEVCYLVQYQPPGVCGDGLIDIVRVDRDREWWTKTAMPALRDFRADIAQFYVDAGRPFGAPTPGLERTAPAAMHADIPNKTASCATQTSEALGTSGMKIYRRAPKTMKQRFPPPGTTCAVAQTVSAIFTPPS